jgi:hypothetical protein
MLQSFQIKNFLIISVITSFIFLWGAPATIGIDFDFRYIILLIAPLVLKEILDDLLKNKNFMFLYLCLGIFSFLILHGIFLKDFLDSNFFYSVFFSIYLFAIAYYYFQLILENKKNIIILFLIIFFISMVATYFFINLPSNPEPFSCGAIKNYLPGKNNLSSKYFFLHFISSYEILFQENSHFAMTSVSIILFSFFLFFHRKISKFFFTILVLFIIISLLKSSATLIAGLLASSIALILFDYKRIGYLLAGVMMFLSILLLYNFTQDVVCVKKINPNFEGTNYIEQTNLKFLQKKSQTTIYPEGVPLNSNEGSISAAVFFHALNVSAYSFAKRPLGWGLQGYETAFLNYNKNNKDINVKLSIYNSKDATNNFFKIITEFGIFGFSIYLLLAFVLIDKKVSLENKIFLFPFLITQSIRGAGYFNGGFLLIMFILLILQFKNK